MDSILLTGIRVQTRIGVPEAERKNVQQILVTIELRHPIASVANADAIGTGIDYAQVTEEVQKLAKTERKTIERFAEDIATTVLTRFRPEGGVTVTVTKKPDLPLESASVTIQRP